MRGACPGAPRFANFFAVSASCPSPRMCSPPICRTLNYWCLGASNSYVSTTCNRLYFEHGASPSGHPLQKDLNLNGPHCPPPAWSEIKL